MKLCKHPEVRWLNCQDCKEKNIPCPLIICCNCGEEVRHSKKNVEKANANNK